MAKEADKPTKEQEVKATEVAEAPAEETKETKKEKTVAKAGKRSAKAIAEVEEEQAKEERKAHAKEDEDKPKPAAKPARSRLERRGKNFRKAAELVDKDKAYPLKEALGLAIKTSPVKFDASVELHINLNVDPKHADQNVRGTVVLPAGTGKTVRIAALTDDKVEGADITGIEAILKQLEKGEINFDVLIASPQTMPQLGKYAKLLGPRGLMPNPKSGTVAANIAKAVQEAKAGRVEYRVDSTGIVHMAVGKVSFGSAKLEENVQAVLGNLKSNKPASVKGIFIKAIHLTTTMGPSIKTIND